MRALTICSAATLFFLVEAQAFEVCPDCSTPAPFQPTESDIASTAEMYDTGQEDFEFSMYGNDQATIVVDGVPYARYWQLEDPSKYVFHPMVWGRYVFNNAEDVDFRKRLPQISERIGVDLPNGGLAFYYPNHYPLNRMRGPDIIYSSISQSEILAGYLRVHQEEENERSENLLSRVKAALFLPYEEGGTDLGVAQLELPLFRSNPEIILNGWLHAILHLSDYAHERQDAEIAEYVRRNLEFFAANHGAWYDEVRNISLYSDTSPHRIVVTPSSGGQIFQAVYRSKVDGLKNYVFEPVMDLDNEYSGFDFRITSINDESGKITMGITCSRLFDTELVSDAPFSFVIRDGGYDPMRASPDSTGDLHEIASEERDGHHVAPIAIADAELICGYPTNFAKANRKNFYHMQHIVALHYLAKDAPYDDEELNRRLIEIASEWLRRTDQFAEEGFVFETPQAVLDSINRGKVRTPFTDAADLLAQSG